MIAGDPLSGPSDASVLVAASAWIQGTLLGTLATVVAIIAIACVGLGMLSGRVNIQRGIVVVLGCFIVFGAPGIAAALFTATQLSQSNAVIQEEVVAAPPPPRPMPVPNPTPYDPYAGASVPTR